ncbi:hypothetical protein OL548_34585 (plasmid) [Lysinibacillus sp. MHQ-1]|nr:hypothetical protein OL548_34585 [Lysinibacillus sp. MHQ-1]
MQPRFSPTDIRELPFKEMIVQVVNERNSIGIPKRAVGQFVHESAFINRFMDLVASDIKSTEEKDFNVTDHVSQDKLDSLVTNVKVGYESMEHMTTEEEILNLTDFHSAIPDEFMPNVSAIGDSVQEFEHSSNDSGFMSPPLQSQAILLHSENKHNNVIQFPVSEGILKHEYDGTGINNTIPSHRDKDKSENGVRNTEAIVEITSNFDDTAAWLSQMEEQVAENTSEVASTSKKSGFQG